VANTRNGGKSGGRLRSVTHKEKRPLPVIDATMAPVEAPNVPKLVLVDDRQTTKCIDFQTDNEVNTKS
jgi:hypothetical protein